MSTGILSEYGIDAERDAVDSGYNDPDPGIYEFEIDDVFVKEGSQANPDASWLIIQYNLEDGLGHVFSKSDMFALPKDPTNPTDDEKQKLGFYVSRLKDLGFARDQANTVGRDDLVGLRGTLQIKQTAGRGKHQGKLFKNISNVKLSKSEAPVAAPAQAPKRSKPVNLTAHENPFA